MTGRLVGFVRWFVVVLAVSMLMFTYRVLAPLAAGHKVRPLDPLITETTAAFSAGLLFFAVAALARRYPLRPGVRLRRLPAYCVGMVIFAMAHTTLMWGSRLALFPLAGLGSYDYGRMPLRYLMEAPFQLIGFALMVGAVHAVGSLQDAREQEVRAARLQRALVDAQLVNLRLQLHPHFLFNALNTISSTMYEDPGAADEMLEALGDLLRGSLRTARTDEVSLAVEMTMLNSYLKLVRARYGDRLHIDIDLEQDADEILVPSMLLQPLVENAIRHGGVERLGHGAVSIRAWVENADLRLQIRDDGPAIESPVKPSADASRGVGLSATRERLRLLYGDRQEMRAGRLSSGGFGVTIRIPCRRATEDTR